VHFCIGDDTPKNTKELLDAAMLDDAPIVSLTVLPRGIPSESCCYEYFTAGKVLKAAKRRVRPFQIVLCDDADVYLTPTFFYYQAYKQRVD